MPAHPKSTAQHKKDGSYRQDRHAKRLDTQGAIGHPKRPDWLDKGQQELWAMVVETLPNEVLGRLDAASLEQLCICWRAIQDLQPQVAADPSDKNLRCNMVAFMQQFQRLSDAFGLSPLARTKLTLPDNFNDRDDPLEGGDFLRG